MSNWTMAEVKARLAGLGVDLSPDAAMQTYVRPKEGVKVGLCVVDAVSTISGQPDYCVHGFASCVSCAELCYLGSETSQIIADRERGVYPICMACATEHIPRTHVPDQHLVDNLRPRFPSG